MTKIRLFGHFLNSSSLIASGRLPAQKFSTTMVTFPQNIKGSLFILIRRRWRHGRTGRGERGVRVRPWRRTKNGVGLRMLW